LLSHILAVASSGSGFPNYGRELWSAVKANGQYLWLIAVVALLGSQLFPGLRKPGLFATGAAILIVFALPLWATSFVEGIPKHVGDLLSQAQ
jgi:hypothetical protein